MTLLVPEDLEDGPRISMEQLWEQTRELTERH